MSHDSDMDYSDNDNDCEFEDYYTSGGYQISFVQHIQPPTLLTSSSSPLYSTLRFQKALTTSSSQQWTC